MTLYYMFSFSFPSKQKMATNKLQKMNIYSNYGTKYTILQVRSVMQCKKCEMNLCTLAIGYLKKHSLSCKVAPLTGFPMSFPRNRFAGLKPPTDREPPLAPQIWQLTSEGTQKKGDKASSRKTLTVWNDVFSKIAKQIEYCSRISIKGCKFSTEQLKFPSTHVLTCI